MIISVYLILQTLIKFFFVVCFFNRVFEDQINYFASTSKTSNFEFLGVDFF